MSFINHQLISNAINLKKAILAVVQCQRLITSDLIIDEGALNPRQGGGGLMPPVPTTFQLQPGQRS